MTIQTDEPICRVMACGKTRAQHTDLNHEFNLEGSLVPKSKRPQPRPGGSTMFSGMAVTGLMMRLMHVLVRKGILDDDDVAYITDPSHGGSRGDSADSGAGEGR